MTMTQVRDAFQEFLYAKRDLRVKTIEEKQQKLGAFCAWCEQHTITLEDIKASTIRHFLETLDGKADLTKVGYARVIKSFLRWCSREEEFEDAVKEKTANRIEIPSFQMPDIAIYSADDIKKLFAACEKEETPFLKVRNRAILSVLLDTGIRASECCYDNDRPQEHTGLRMQHVNLETFDSHITVIGKGRGTGKSREIGLGIPHAKPSSCI
jgi:site-specific recombinase XerD